MFLDLDHPLMYTSSNQTPLYLCDMRRSKAQLEERCDISQANSQRLFFTSLTRVPRSLLSLTLSPEQIESSQLTDSLRSCMLWLLTEPKLTYSQESPLRKRAQNHMKKIKCRVSGRFYLSQRPLPFSFFHIYLNLLPTVLIKLTHT